MPVDTPESVAVEQLQHNDRASPLTKAITVASLGAAGVLLIANLWRLSTGLSLAPEFVLALLALGWLAADFMSGVVHWAADTWGRVDTPFLGRRFLHPFRVHHVNPKDILSRDFVDLNGDVAMLVVPFLTLAVVLPLDRPLSQGVALFLVALGGFVLPTNQIHQWAHEPQPPLWVRFLQRTRLVLTSREHARHHADPPSGHYCITNGWCNPLLQAIGFFPRSERCISWVTGFQPRVEAVDAWVAKKAPVTSEALPTGAENR